MSVFRFRVRDSTESGAEADSDPSLWLLPGPTESRVLERKFRRADRELRIAIEPLQPMRRKKFLGIQSALRCAVGVEDRTVECSHLRIRSSARKPFRNFPANPDGSNGTEPGDDCASSRFIHQLSRRGRSCLSLDVGLHRPQGFIGNMVDEKIADNRFGNRRELRNAKA